ncbi:MAG: arginyltransferase [Pseudomonadota bacterium]
MTDTSIKLYQGTPHGCAYLPEQQAVMHVVDPQFPLSASHYGILLEAGFRRSGNMVYRPGCPSCSACKPARIDTRAFLPNRSQRRCLKKNRDIELRVAPTLQQQHFELYRKYLMQRHADGEMSADSIADMQQFLLSEWSETLLLEGWLDEQLLFVAVTDVVDNGLSALYTFFDPEMPRRGLGTYGILQQIEQARQLGLKWLYLGYWIAECRKMAYKGNFNALQVLHHNRGWQALK